MERIGLYGGMFDPVHIGHLHAAKMAAERMSLSRVIFIPAKIPPHKKSGCYASGEHRLSMLQLAIEEDARFSVSDYELTREGVSYSYLTAEHFAKVFPNAMRYFIIGDEAYSLIHTWKKPDKIRKTAEFLVVTRAGTPPPEDALYVEIPKLACSSTEVRRALACGESVRAFLPEAVEAYIKKNELYRG